MGPWELSNRVYAAFNAGQYRAWRGQFMELAKEHPTSKGAANCVRLAREYHKRYLRCLAYALGKEFPQ